MNLHLEDFNEKYLRDIWNFGFVEECPEWTKYNAPYFDDYIQYKTFELFLNSSVANFLLSNDCKAIVADSKAIGMVSKNWVDQKTRWLEIGIVIYNSNYWNKGIGCIILKKWITYIFQSNSDLEHIGLTTWSGNQGMIHLSEKLNLVKEAQIRKVRYYQGIYYDSLKYGVLRNEWINFKE